jgi:hypothetical protein
MSKIALSGNASGTGTFTFAAPGTNTDRTLTLPDATGTVLTDQSTVSATQITGALNATGSAPIFACRAWVNFNGQGTVAIRASGNVSSITDNGVGDYTINFTTAMPDANYCVIGMSSANIQTGTNPVTLLPGVSIINDPNTYQLKSTSQVRLFNDSTVDTFDTNVAVFR